jgi:hypothetical protein
MLYVLMVSWLMRVHKQVLARKASAAKSTYFSMWAAHITGANQRIVGFNPSSDITLLPTPRDCLVLPGNINSLIYMHTAI